MMKLKTAAQIIFFLAISWGLVATVFAYERQLDFSKAAYLINKVNHGDDLMKHCKALFLSESAFLKNDYMADKAKATCQYELFSVER